jgi:hypothetical protein
MGKKDKKQAVPGTASSSANGKPIASTSAAAAAVVAKPAKVASTANKTSEIDDIFAGKKSLPAKAADNEGTASISTATGSKSNQKKKRKLQDVADESTTSATNGSKADSNAVANNDIKGKGKSKVQDTVAEAKAPAVNVVDASSIPGVVSSKKRKSDKTSEGTIGSKTTATPSIAAAAKEDDELFRDSRGTSTSKFFTIGFGCWTVY